MSMLLNGSSIQSEIAIFWSPDTRWAFDLQTLVANWATPSTSNFNYVEQACYYYRALKLLGLNVDIVFPSSDLSKYKLLIIPTLFVTTDEIVANITQFVNAGGSAVFTFRSGVKDQYNTYVNTSLPGPFASLAGITIHNSDPQLGQTQTLIPEGSSNSYPTSIWFDLLNLTTAQPLAIYGQNWYAGSVGVSVNQYNNGWVYYVGSLPTTPDFYYWFIGQVGIHCSAIPVNPLNIPLGVELNTRTCSDPSHKMLFFMNYTNQTQTIYLPDNEEIIQGKIIKKTNSILNLKTGKLTLPNDQFITINPWDVAVVIT